MKRKNIFKIRTLLLAAMLVVTSIFLSRMGELAYAEEDEFLLSTDAVNKIWLGDSVETYLDVTEITILEGDSVVVEDGLITAIDLGYSKVQVSHKENWDSETTETVIYEINVVEREAELQFVGVPESIKLGQEIEFTVQNGNYGKLPCMYISEPNNCFSMPGSGGPKGNYRTRSAIVYTAVEEDGEVYENLATIALHPGQFLYGLYDDSDFDNANLISSGTIIIEAPVIETNAPSTVEPNSSLDFTTNLGNIYLEDEEIVGLFNEIYVPQVTIIEGSDCVASSNQLYEGISTSETLTFVKEGTVKIQVKYVPKDIEDISDDYVDYVFDNCESSLYTAEKTFTIIVEEEVLVPSETEEPSETETEEPSETETEEPSETETEEPSETETEEPSETETEEPSETETEEPSETETEIPSVSNGITEEEAQQLEAEAVVEGIDENSRLEVSVIPETSEKLEIVYQDEAIKDKQYTVLELTLTTGGTEIQPNGKIKIQLPLTNNIKDAAYVEVFRLNESTNKLDSLGVVEVIEGKFTFETDHFSIYVFAKASEGSIDKFGDVNAYGNIMIFTMGAIMLISGTVVLFLNKRKTIG